VALVESTTRDLDRLYTAELKRANREMLGTPETGVGEPAQPVYGVDSDLLNVVDGEVANL
jgi:hypothetical protein